MNIRKICPWLVLPALLVTLALLSACNKGEGEETGTTTTTGAEETTEAATPAPRYDYFAADVKADVSIDPAVYADMKLTLPSSLRITDRDVTDFIDSQRFKYRTADNGTIKVTDQPLKLGDSAFIYYRGVLDGKEFEGGSNMNSANPTELGLGSGSFIPGFEEGLVGVIPGETSKEAPFALHVTFPEDYGVDELNGKEVIFYVVVEYAVQYTIPEYTRDFVVNTLKYTPKEDVYGGDRALLNEYEAYVKEQLEKEIETSVLYAKTDAIWAYLTEHATCRNKPQSEIEVYYNSSLSEIQYNYEMYKYYYGESFTAMYPDAGSFAVAYMGIPAGADWKASLLDLADRMVQKDMIAHAIGEIEGIESVTDEEYRAQVTYWASQSYVSEEQVIAQMGEAYLKESAFADKMAEWLLERATFTFEE